MQTKFCSYCVPISLSFVLYILKHLADLLYVRLNSLVIPTDPQKLPWFIAIPVHSLSRLMEMYHKRFYTNIYQDNPYRNTRGCRTPINLVIMVEEARVPPGHLERSDKPRYIVLYVFLIHIYMIVCLWV